MKCIQCGIDNNLKDRTANSGRCKSCNHPFAFEPSSMGISPITDPFFAKAIADISTNNTLFFTPKQLFYLLDRRAQSKDTIYPLLHLFFYIFSLLFVGGVLYMLIAGITGNNNLLFVITLIVNIVWIFSVFSNIESLNSNPSICQKYARSLRIIGIFNLLVGIPFSISIESFIDFIVITFIGLLEIYLGNYKINHLPSSQTFVLDKNQFQTWLNRWQQINGNISKLLPSPRGEITPTAVSPDVTAYSFDRLIVCDSAIIAQLLIANNFHFENNCAILSVTGYPQSIFATAMEMLRRNPDLKVYTLHDCSPRGVGLANRLRRSENWFLNTNFPLIDIGILPRQVIAAKRDIFIQNSPDFGRDANQLPAEIRSELSAEELAWLDSGNFVELESFSPQKLIQILHRGIAGSENLEVDNSGLVVIGDTDGSYIYVAESFG